MSEPFLECVGCGRDYPMSTVNARCRQCDAPLEVKFNLGSVPRNWFQNQRSGFFARRYAPFYPYLEPHPLFSLGEGQTTLLRSVCTVEQLGLEALFLKTRPKIRPGPLRIAGRPAASKMPLPLDTGASAHFHPATWGRRLLLTAAEPAWIPSLC